MARMVFAEAGRHGLECCTAEAALALNHQAAVAMIAQPIKQAVLIVHTTRLQLLDNHDASQATTPHAAPLEAVLPCLLR
jgi:hypothetical protein